MWKPIILDVQCIVCNKTLQKINHDPLEVSRTMGKITNRRSRTPNWSVDEKHYLLELINKYKDVVMSKSNNGPNLLEEKDVVWNEILRKLAGKFGNKFSGFSIKKVKTQWQNMKRIAREEIHNNGSEFQKYTKLSLDVCNLLQLIKDGVPVKDNINETTISTDIEIKTECIDDEMTDQNDSIGYDLIDVLEDRNETNVTENSSELTTVPELTSDLSVVERLSAKGNIGSVTNSKTTETMTDDTFLDNMNRIVNLRKELEELVRCTESEKQLKLESLKDQRQIMRAMRETAELNKIIAEQKLKHVLWIQKQETASRSGMDASSRRSVVLAFIEAYVQQWADRG